MLEVGQVTVTDTPTLIYTNDTFDHVRLHLNHTREDELVGVYLKDGASREMSVDGSVTPVDFEFVVPAARRLQLAAITIQIVDNMAHTASSYGGGSALTNGMALEVDTGTVVIDLLDGFPITTNSQWTGFAFLYEYTDVGSGDNVSTWHWEDHRAGSMFSVVEIDSGGVVSCRVSDDLTGISSATMFLHGGYIESSVFYGVDNTVLSSTGYEAPPEDREDWTIEHGESVWGVTPQGEAHVSYAVYSTRR
jgi:hypothetical protein